MIGSNTKNGNGIKINAELIVQKFVYKYRSKYVLLWIPCYLILVIFLGLEYLQHVIWFCLI